MRELEKLLAEDILIVGTVPIGASLIDREAANAEAGIRIAEIAYDRSQTKAKWSENRFVEARIIRYLYNLKQSQYGVHVEFDALVQILMRPYTTPESP